MNDATKEMLATIARCVTEGGASLATALESAYQLGKIDGGTEMASIGMNAVAKLLEPA